MKKKAELFTVDKLVKILEEQGKELGYKVDSDIDYDIENTATISYLGDDNKLYLSVVVLYGGIYTKINIFDQNDKNIFSKSIRAANFDMSEYKDVIDKVYQELNKNIQFLLSTPEKIYDYGEENNWQGLDQKHYEILSQDKNLAQMAVADMQDKELEIPETLKKFRRYSMSFKEIVVSKIAKEKIATKKVASATKILKKKAAEEDLDVKLKVQKNKPAGLDTSTPKSLPESIRPLMQDLKGKISDVKEIETQLAARKAELDAKYQEAKNESKIVEKQAEIENLTNNIGKLLFAAKNETFQFQDNLVALTHQTKVVPAKATDKWKFEKVFEKLKSLMGDDNAQKFLDATLNGLQSQATEKTITELNIFSPTQKQLKTSDTSDTNKLIDALKEIYTNLRAYFLDVKKANNILEEQLATGATASKKSNVSKKAKMHKKAADNKVRIFLTNLGKYNEGELVGEWVDLPVQNFKPILDKIGIDGKNYEEVFITDYEAPFEIGEYENINALNEKVKKIETLDEEQKDILYSLADEWDFDELYEKVANGNYTYIPQGSIKNAIGEAEASNIDLAYGYIDMLGGIEGMSKETLEEYFDYDSYGETLSYDYTTTDKGYVLID